MRGVGSHPPLLVLTMVLSIYESDFKKGIQELNPEIHFDMAAGLNIHQPRHDDFQGVFYRGNHIGAMGRGQIPEWNRYATVTEPDGTVRRSHVVQVGWRTTFDRLVKKNIPGVTWESLSRKFGFEYKPRTWRQFELEGA